MPGGITDGSIVLESATLLNYDRLRLALRDASLGSISPAVADAVLSEMSENRPQISSPLGPELVKRPDESDRSKMEGRSTMFLTLPSRDGIPGQRQVPLTSAHIGIALSLSAELDINELDAALLLVNARASALTEGDADVVVAARRLFDVGRRESLFYLQELLRAPLVPTGGSADAQNFLGAIVQERDILVSQHHIITKIVERLTKAIKFNLSKTSTKRDALREGEAVLLAECLFLLAYTVQVSPAEALAIRDLLELIASSYKTLVELESAAEKPNRWTTGIPHAPSETAPEPSEPAVPEIKSASRVELESARNLVLLSWICALDRSRYQDVYDPRTGESGINMLLTDERFISQTANLPPLAEEGEDQVASIDQAVNASSLAAAIFRLAVAEPNEAEAVGAALRVSAYGDALAFFANDLPAWIESGAGSLGPDADLYADALEDLALDMAEAPNLSNALMSFTQNEIIAAASEAAFASFDESGGVDEAGFPVAPPPSLPAGTPSLHPQADYGSKPPLPTPSIMGRPPIQPASSRALVLLDTPRQNAFQNGGAKQELEIAGEATAASSFRFGQSNLIALLARFAGRAIKLAPKKLLVDSISSGPRYWVSVGAPGNGLIPRIGDAVIDIWDAASKNAYAPGGVGEAFIEALDGFLGLLAASAGPNGSSVHSASALRYLSAAGHPVVNINLTARALQHFNEVLSSPMTPMGTMFDDAEVQALCGILDVISAAAEGLRDDGGVGPILAEVAHELPMHIATLAVHDVSPKLKASLVSALAALDDRRSITLFLESASAEKASPLRRLIRAYEGETGDYDVTVRVLKLTESCTKWPDEDYPASAVDAIATWFAIEEVLLNWSRRKYSTEFQRWTVVKAAASMVLSLSQRSKLNEEGLVQVWGRLLMPAPGTGAASSSLRALIAACGLLRYPEERALDNPPMHPNATYMHAWGQDLLVQTADHGLGSTYREMEKVVGVCSRLISGLFEIPAGLAASIGMLCSSPGDLLAVETNSIVAAGTMVFSVRAKFVNAYKAGYSHASCKSVLAMLATGATHSSNICSLLARDAEGLPATASPFRSCLADIVANGGEEFDVAVDSPEDGDASRRVEEPIMHSALRIVENCLGSDGGSPPGLFLLGLQLDTSGRYIGSSYGVLGALIELVAGYNDGSGRMDSKNRATASIFLQRLVANTVRKTSRAVLEHIRVLGESDKSIRGGGFADEMLFKLLDFSNTVATSVSGSDVEFNWRALVEFATSLMSLSALQVRVFPGLELERIIHANKKLMLPRIGFDGNDATVRSFNGTPSPCDLFRLIELMSKNENHDVVFEAFRSWYVLLGVRVQLYTQQPSCATVPMYLELVELLLSALANGDSSNEIAVLVRKDGGQTACAAILTCVQHICDTQGMQNIEPQDNIDEFQASSLLGGIVRGIAGLAGTSADVSRGRTSLYAAFLQAGQVVENLSSDEGVARAFGGRMGSQQVSGTEAVLTTVCIDASSGPTPATMAVALAAACWTTHLDPVRAIPTLSSQNRLRRIVARTIADAEARSLIGSACSRSISPATNADPEVARENAAIVVGEATLALIQTISTCSNGSRALVDSGCVEALVSLLSALERSRRANITTEGQENEASELIVGDGMTGTDAEEKPFFHAAGPGERRASLVGSIASAIAAAMTVSDPVLVDGAMGLLEKGTGCFTDVLRMVRSGRPAFLEALSALSLILSRAPPSVTAASKEAGQLRLSLAGALNVFVAPRRTTAAAEPVLSNLGASFMRRKPLSAREAMLMKVWHPYGGSVFDREVAAERISCLHSVMAALRSPHGLQELFKTRLGSPHGHGGVSFVDETTNSMSDIRDSQRKIPVGDLMDVVRICRASLLDIRRFSEESLQASALASGDGAGSLTAQKLAEYTAFCEAKYGPLDGTPASTVGCMTKEAEYLRGQSNRCISIFESALFILREYMRAARGAVRGEPDFDVDADVEGEERERHRMTASEGQMLIEQAKDDILPLCREIDASGIVSWGSKDAGFCKQLSRQIRAYIGQ